MEEPAKAAIPIIAVTANAFEEDRKSAMETGMDGHLAKPYDVPKMMDMIYGTLKDILPAGQLGNINSMSQKDYEKAGIKLTGKLTIEDGCLSMAVVEYGVEPIMKINLNMQIKNPGRTDIPEDVKQMVDAIKAK